ncbi:patatin-like phospholipase family protein [Vibrio mexicanus]|uniref:patatin-like phospholipase family protein n=1 Tax=Vibrio mexicanus TaxID=1004326 RepID=UPI000B2A1442|nr:patatin-like phospholipase family protein [Vibrio mexicanus]
MKLLVLSGGGAKGAYGVGFLNGLYEQQRLDTYSVVTGVSAGALMAPFVFLGGEEIPRLKETILGLDDEMLMSKTNIFHAIFKEGYSDGESFFSFIEETYSDEMIELVAEQHRLGRRLLIGTTQIDADQLVVWNLGQIAASDMPNKAKLFHQVLAASASIPGVFPPQVIDVELNGEMLEELHVDGGLSAQMFLQAVDFEFDGINQALGLNTKPQVHVIRNGMLTLPYSPVKDNGVSLLGRTLSSLTTQQSRGDLYRMLYFSEVQGFDLAFTYIDHEFDEKPKPKTLFDRDYMKVLYQHGYQQAQGDKAWTTEVPY